LADEKRTPAVAIGFIVGASLEEHAKMLAANAWHLPRLSCVNRDLKQYFAG
jgi:hypothetical protein